MLSPTPRVQIPLEQVRDLVRVGEALPFHVMDAQDRRLLACGQTIISEHQMEMLFERGAWVPAAEVQTLRRQRIEQAEPQPSATPARATSLFDRWEHLVWELDGVLRDVLRGRPAADELDALASRLIALVDRDADVALYMTIRHNEPRFALYALDHALHSATVALVLARQLGWPAPRALCLVKAALSMNVAMLELQATLAVQDYPPNTRQRAQILAHPAAGADLLRAAGVSDPDLLEAVLQHHERQGGGGYPAGLPTVGELAHALRTVDVFTAKISPRAMRPALKVQIAARQLFEEDKGGALAVGLIRALGLYPPGDLVQLKNGEIAVVIRRGGNATTPQVAAISDGAGKATVGTLLRDTRLAEYAIAGPAQEPTGRRILPERVYGLMAD